MLQLQGLGRAATLTNTLDKKSEPQGFAEVSKSEARMDSMQEELSSLINNQTWTLVDLSPGRKAIRCGWIFKGKKTNTELSTAPKGAWWQKDIPRNQKSTKMTLYTTFDNFSALDSKSTRS
jgi:hypothetical protein